MCRLDARSELVERVDDPTLVTVASNVDLVTGARLVHSTPQAWQSLRSTGDSAQPHFRQSLQPSAGL